VWPSVRRGARPSQATTGPTAAALAPDAIDEGATHLRIDGEWARTIALSAWAGSVPWGWLMGIGALRERLVLALHLLPQDSARMGTRRALFEHIAGLESTLPAARDRLGHRKPIPGEIVAATYPFGSPVLCMPDGVWYGRNTQNNTPLIVDPYAFTSSNSVVIG